jgi:hypothetical protein
MVVLLAGQKENPRFVDCPALQWLAAETVRRSPACLQRGAETVKVFPALSHQMGHQIREIALFSAYHHGELSHRIPPSIKSYYSLKIYHRKRTYALSLFQTSISWHRPVK